MFQPLVCSYIRGLCNFVSVFDNSGEGSNRIIARVDNTLHLCPQQSPVAKVTWPCVNTFPLEGRHLPEWILPWLCGFSSFSMTSRLTELHAAAAKRESRRIQWPGWPPRCTRWIFNVPSGVSSLHQGFTCIAVKPGLCVCVFVCLCWFALKGSQLFSFTLYQYNILHNPALLLSTEEVLWLS